MNLYAVALQPLQGSALGVPPNPFRQEGETVGGFLLREASQLCPARSMDSTVSSPEIVMIEIIIAVSLIVIALCLSVPLLYRHVYLPWRRRRVWIVWAREMPSVRL